MKKIQRDAFIYLEPTYATTKETFAQCGSCALFNRDNSLCLIMDIGVVAGGSCDFYLEGPQRFDEAYALVTPFEAGYVERQVRCENCAYAMSGRCGLYLQLNSMFPDIFDLDPRISPYGCCNANTPKADP